MQLSEIGSPGRKTDAWASEAGSASGSDQWSHSLDCWKQRCRTTAWEKHSCIPELKPACFKEICIPRILSCLLLAHPPPMCPHPTSHPWSDNRGISGHWCLQWKQGESCQNKSEWALRNMWPFSESKLLPSYSARVWDKTVSMKRPWESNRQQQSLRNDLKQKSCGIITKFQWEEIAIKLRNCHHKENQLVDKILYGRKREETQIMNPWGQLLTNQRPTPQVKACAPCYMCPPGSQQKEPKSHD